MNEAIAAILARRSIRKYLVKPIGTAERDLIIKCGLHAPSAKNAQAWHIVAVQNPAVIGKITEEVKAAILRATIQHYLGLAKSPKYTVNFINAPLFMIVSADPAGTACPKEDCAVLLENMFIAAESLGIGSCWINQLGCITDEPAFRKYLTELGVPEHHKVYGSACFGYADGPAAPAELPRKEGTVRYWE